MNKPLHVALSALVLVSVSGCLEMLDQGPIMLEGRNTPLTNLDEVRTQFDYVLDVRATSASSGQAIENDPYRESQSGRMRRQFAFNREATNANLFLQAIYDGQDQFGPFQADERVVNFSHGVRQDRSDVVVYRDELGEVAGPEGAILFQNPLVVGNAHRANFYFAGQVDNSWRVYALVTVLRTEVVATAAGEIEGFVVRVQGDNVNDFTYGGSNALYYEHTYWVSPQIGIFREQQFYREWAPNLNANITTRMELNLTGFTVLR